MTTPPSDLPPQSPTPPSGAPCPEPAPGPAPAPEPAPNPTNSSRLLDWAEAAGIENLKERHAALAMLRAEASTTLTVVLAGLGGTLTYAAKMAEPPAAGAVAFGAMCLCIYFALLAIFIVSKCMLVKEISSIYNEPQNLAQLSYSIESVKEEEVVRNMPERVKEMVKVNKGLACNLNGARMAAALSPLVFAIAAFFYHPSSQVAVPSALKLECKPAAASAPTLACKMLP